MLSTPLAILAMASGISAQFSPPRLGQKFGVTVTGTGIPGNTQLTASVGRIFAGGKQDPSCDDNTRQDYATFATYSDNGLYLWGKTTGSPVQQVWVDASGMGQGICGYTTGNQAAPKNASRGKFVVDPQTGDLTFDGIGAKACPSTEEGQWSIWFTTLDKPGWQDDCVDVKLEAYGADARAGCEYTPST